MAHENRRQWERFLYPTELQLTAGGHHNLPAKLVDVSRHGMQVVAPVLLHIGDEVSASLPAALPTPPAAGHVRGRVCWTAPASAAGTPQTRAGIVFEAPLPEAEPPRAIVDETAGSSVIVQFSGAMPQVMARAIETDNGMRLRFALPCLRQGSVITLHSQHDAPQEMRVVGAQLAEGGSQVELVVEPCPETRKRRFLQYDEPAPAAGAEAAQPAPTEATDAEALTVPSPKPRRVLAGLAIGASLMAAIWITARLTHPHQPLAKKTSPEVATRAIKQVASAAPASKPELVTAPDTRAAPAPHTVAPAALSGSQSASNAAPAPELRAKPASAGSFAITTTKDTTEIFVPLTGSLAGLNTKIWTDPPAVVVELPRGQFALARKHYDIQRDGVVGISVGRPGGVTQLRVYVNSILSQYNATAVPGGVSIRIKRDLQSLP